MEFDLLFQEGTEAALADCEHDLITDLKLDNLLRVMAGDDRTLYAECEKILARPCTSPCAIAERQAVMRDAISHPELFRGLYGISAKAIAATEKLAEFVAPQYDKVVPNSKRIVAGTDMASVYLNGLNDIGEILNACDDFTSPGMRRLKDAVQGVLEGSYYDRVSARLSELAYLKEDGGIEISGHIGQGLKLGPITLNRTVPQVTRLGNRRQLKKSGNDVIELDHINLIQNAEEMSENSLRPILAIIKQFNRSMEAIFRKLKVQTGFYMGCERLHARLTGLGVALCFPTLMENGIDYQASGLVDAGLAIQEQKGPVGNDIHCGSKRLWIITGANQGGKTTFLRSIGLAQVMAQSGIFVAARSLSCPLHAAVYTHFPNGEDKEMNSGLLEVELRKLDSLIQVIRPNTMLLMNESFSTTTPREAAFLANEITRALRDSGVVTLFVTHLFAYADSLWRQKPDDVLFLRALREEDGQRCYRLEEGAPCETSYGNDLFQQALANA